MKAKFLALAALVLGMVSCQTDVVEGLHVDANGEAELTLQVGLPEATRAAGADSALGAIGNINMAEYDIRYVLNVYDENGILAKGPIYQYEDESTSTQFSLRLVPGRAYKFVVWADFVEQGKKTALYYNVDNFAEIKTIGTHNPMDEARDAYTGFYVESNFSNTSNISFELTRPFAKLRVVTTDMNQLYSNLVSAQVVYTSRLYTTFNAIEAEATGLESTPGIVRNVYFSTMTYTNESASGTTGVQTLFADYFFGSEDNRVMFTLDVADATNLDIPTVNFNTNIPVERNHLTTVQGNILTDSNNITVTIDSAFEQPNIDVEWKEASTAQELVEIFEDVAESTTGEETHIVLTGDINLNDLLNLTRAENNITITIPNGKVVDLDLGGYTLSATDTTEKNFSVIDNRGTLTVKNGKIKVNATVNSGWSRYSAALANNPGGNLTVDGVTLEHLGGTDMAYGIDNLTNGKGTSAITTIKNSTIKSPYRAVRQFLNGVEATNEMYVKAGAKLYGDNKSIFFHDPSKSANTGKLVVEEGAELYGDVYLFVTAGSTEWPVEVSIAASALAEGKEVLTANVPEGYVVELDNGVYTVSYYDAVVSDFSALNTAVAAGKNVLLAADIDCGTTQLAISGANQVVNLGGHTLKTNMSYGGMAIKNGASIKNGTIEHTSTVAAIKAFNVGSIENVTINATCTTANKTITAIAVQQGGYVGAIKNVKINGVSQGIEVGYQATVDSIENATVVEATNGTANGIALVINGGKVVKAKNSSFKGAAYGVTMHLKGVFAVGLDLENCYVEGETASIYAWDEKGISNTSGSLNLTYDAATTLVGSFVWDFEEECQSVVTLNCPE